MRKLDLISGGILSLLALVLAVRAYGLGFLGPTGPKAGFFPLLLSILLGFFSCLIIVNAWLKAPSTKTPKILGTEKKKLFFYVFSYSLFGFILPWLGYTLTVTAYFILLLRFVEKRTWRLTIAVVFSSIIISYLLFTRLLEMSLPEGLLTPIANLIFESDT
jgi:putative tricarboxylic transport membrane protein